jgi:ABC-type transporter Mla subunit MlaD
MDQTQQVQQALQKTNDLLKEVREFLDTSRTYLDEILKEVTAAEKENGTRQAELDNEIEKIADDVDSSLLDLAEDL